MSPVCILGTGNVGLTAFQVGNEFSSVEALWSTFENVMAKDPEAVGKENHEDGETEHEEGDTTMEGK